MSENSNTVQFAMGERYKRTQVRCPKCLAPLYIDQMGDESTLICLTCDYTKESEEIAK